MMAWVSDPVIPKKPNQSSTEVLAGFFWKTETLNLLPFQKEMSFSNPIDFQGWSVSFSGVYHSFIPLPWVLRSWWSCGSCLLINPKPLQSGCLKVQNWIRPLMRIWKGLLSNSLRDEKKSRYLLKCKCMGENNQSAGHKPSAIPSKHLKTGPREAACWPVSERICASMSWENENCGLVEYATNIFKKDCA